MSPLRRRASRAGVTGLSWAVLVLVVAGILVWAAWPGGERSDTQRVRDLASEMRCPDCESLSVADSQTASARAVRADLADRVAAGERDADIRRAYVDRYGESILLKPEDGGLGLVVWGLPVAALVLGGGGLVLALRRWRAEPRLHPTAADETLVARAREDS